jgi:hypothetical protein
VALVGVKVRYVTITGAVDASVILCYVNKKRIYRLSIIIKSISK